MASQFDKFVKILGTGSRPDRFKGAPGNPDIVASVETNIPSKENDLSGGGKQPARKRSSRSMLADLRTPRSKTSSPEPRNSSGPIGPIPADAVNTKVDKTNEQKDIEAGESAFSKSEAAKGSGLRSLYGITYDINEYAASLPGNKISSAPAPYNISEFEPKPTRVATGTAVSGSPSSKPLKEPTFLKVDKIKARRGGTVHGTKEVRDYETEHPDSPASSAATRKTLSEANKKSQFTELSKITGTKAITAPDTDVIEEKLTDSAHDLRASMSEENKPDITSTTMREVPSGRPDKVLGHIPVRSPRELAKYEKPTVNKPGNVIPPMAIDTFGAQPTDRKQAEAENKRLRKNRGTPVTTTVFDPNVRSARPVRGQTPERGMVLGAIREKRSAALASEGKTMTTVAPEVMDTAKRLGRTSAYNLDESYMNTPGFLSHESVQKATVAHALGVHHTLGTDDDHLAKYLGGRPLEAKSRLAAAYKVVDRNLRGNPEKVVGEFALLRGMVHAGSSPQQTLRAIKNDKSNNVVVNGQNVTIAAGSSENRQKIASTTSAITAQTEAAPKIARGATAATPTAPLAGTNRVAVRKVGQPPEAAEIREFSPQEARNRKNVPGLDDSKGPRVIDTTTVGLKPGEKPVNKILKEEKDS